MNEDSLGVVCQIRSYGVLECGDGTAWTGYRVYLDPEFAKKYRYHFTFRSNKFPGAYVRHPFGSRTDNEFGAYYKNPWDGVISRDQMIGILLATIAQKKWWEGFLIFFHHAAWLWLFTYNTRDNGKDPKQTPWKLPDFTDPGIWALEVRAMGPLAAIPLWPLLNVFDLVTLVMGIIQNFRNTEHAISFTGRYLGTVYHYPTIASGLLYLIVDRSKLLERLKRYWTGFRSLPEMYELYESKLGAKK